MSLLFDQNLSRKLVALLAAEYPGSEHVVAAGLSAASDVALWSYAKTKGLAIVSKDSDFTQLAAAHGAPPKFIWLHLGNGPTSEARDLLRGRLTDVRVFLGHASAAVLELP